MKTSGAFIAFHFLAETCSKNRCVVMGIGIARSKEDILRLTRSSMLLAHLHKLQGFESIPTAARRP